MPAARTPIGLVIHVHAFADEMNKSRRMAALQARDLSDAGFAVLQLDLFGCGDSDGDFGQASWQGWCADIDAARDWLVERYGADLPLWLWGHRAGALLAVAASARWSQPCHYVFWQPFAMGRAALQQFLRLRSMGVLSSRAPAVTLEQLRTRLRNGNVVDVAGYLLPSAVAQGLEHAELLPPQGATRQVAWLDLSSQDDADMLPASAQAVATWRAQGHVVTAAVLRGPAFWQTTEVEVVPELVAVTTRACVRATMSLVESLPAAR